MSTEIEVKTDTEVLPNKEKGEKSPKSFGRQRPPKKARPHLTVLRICLDGMMTALYIGLTFLKIRLGNVQISFAALPLCFATLASGLPDGLIVALLGSFLEQLTSGYGLGPTTVFWMIPHLLRVLVLFLFDYISRRHGKALYDRPVLYFVGMIVSALVLTLANTLAMYLDSLVIGYAIEIVFVETIIRLAISLASSIIVALILLPVIRTLKKNGTMEKIKRSHLNEDNNKG